MAKLKKNEGKKKKNRTMNYKTVVWLSVLVTEKNKFACQRWKQPVLQSERFTNQAPWKISSFSTPQEGNTIP